jgi:hypothetical protein
VRQLGGELGRARPENGAFAAVGAEYAALCLVGIAPLGGSSRDRSPSRERQKKALNPWAIEQMYLQLRLTRRDARTLWMTEAYHRLRRIKATIASSDPIQIQLPACPTPAPPCPLISTGAGGPGASWRA